MITPAGFWQSDATTGLRRDPFVRLYAALVALEVLFYVAPFTGPVERAAFGNYVFLFPPLAVLVAGTFAGLHPVADREEQRFWRQLGLGFACWLFASLVAAAFTGRDQRRSLDVLIDSTFLASYLLPLVSIIWRPDLGSGEIARRLDRALRSFGIVVIAGGWFAYFVLIPAVVDPGFYASVVPSYLGFLALDLLLIALSLASALVCADRRWRRTYLVFAAAAISNGLLDLLDLLSASGHLDWPNGARTDLLSLIPPGLYLVTVRLRLAASTPPLTAPAPSPGAGEATPVRTASVLLAGAFTFPLVHVWLGTIPFASDALKRWQAALVLVILVVLATMATAGYGALARRHRALEAERRSLEDQLRSTQRLETVGRLAGSVAHDFNNLLTAMSGYTDLARESLPPDDPNLPLLDEVRRSAERAQGLTRQLLAFSRRQVLRLEPIDLGRTVDTMAPMIARLIGEDIALETRLGDGLGLVMADPGQIESVLLNLAGNARDAMPQGGRLTIVTENLETPPGVGPGAGGHVQLVVRDTGRGIPPDVLPHIFEPFFSTKERAKGTGLGLASVYGIVTQLGGTITASSEPGRGAAFTIVLPPAGDAPASGPLAGSGPAPPGPMRGR